MHKLDLKEYVRSCPVRLSVEERDALGGAGLSLTIEPVSGVQGEYFLTPSSTVGAVEIDDLSVLIEPKIGIKNLLWMASFAIGQVDFRTDDFSFPENCPLPDALALALASQARRAFSRGLLHGYINVEDSLYTVRGRIRFDEQMRRRFGIPLPVEVSYDEFTDDIPANRLVKAAAERLRHLRLRSTRARTGLGWVAAMLDNVSLVGFPPAEVPEVTFDRLNEHYRDVVTLSRLILQNRAFEADRGKVRASGFLMDMNQVFQEFVTVAIREELGLSYEAFRERSIATLDYAGKVSLRPDLVWRSGSRCLFVGDAKYKNVTGEKVPNADIYQMLAYCTAANLPYGLLIYAKGEEADPAEYVIRNTSKTIEVTAIDLEGQPEDILADVGRIAERIEERAMGERRFSAGLATPASARQNGGR